MNLTKKLIFGLLLAGALFTTACGSDGPKEGDTCAKEDDCGTELACNMSTKKCEKKAEKLANGEDCTEHDKCTSGFCDLAGDKKCADAPADGSVADGGTCSKKEQCKTTGAACDANKCTVSTGKANDEDCTKDNECTSGFCDLGGGGTNKCKDAPGDASVDGEHHCTASKQCKDKSSSMKGLCMDASAFGMSTICTYSCTTPTECSSIDSSLTCGEVTPVAGGTKVQGCTVGAPATKPSTPDAACKKDPGCGGGLTCVGLQCKPASAVPGANSVADGGKCSEDTQCQNGHTCKTDTMTCGA